MGDFIASNSRYRIVALTLLSVGFVLLGLWLIGAFGPPPASSRYSAPMMTGIGWISLIFFGLCGSVWVAKLLDTRAQLEIGQSGIRWRPWSDQLIPWAAIRDVTTLEVQGQKFIVLHLRDPSRFPGRGLKAALAGVNRRLAGGDIFISLTGTDRAFDDAMDALARFRN
jgi:hypothetical protein